MKKIWAIIAIPSLLAVAVFSVNHYQTGSQESIQGDWVAYSESKTVLPKTSSADSMKKILDVNAATSDKIAFTQNRATFFEGSPSPYQLHRKQKQISVNNHSYDYALKQGRDSLTLRISGEDEKWTTYYRVGSRLEKRQQNEIKTAEKEQKAALSELNKTWAKKADFIENTVKESLVGTWSGRFKATQTTALGVAWSPGMQTLTFDIENHITFHASSDNLTNFDTQAITNAYASYQINGILGLAPSDHIPTDPEKILSIIRSLSNEELFSRIMLISFSYDVTTSAGTISQDVTLSGLSYKDGKLSFDEPLVITQCGDEGVQLSGETTKVVPAT